MKNLHHDPRPYFSEREVKTYECSFEYGNPSGHSLFASGVFIYLFLDTFHNSSTSLIRYTKFTYYLWLTITVFMIISMGFARIYLGVHSIDQIIYGWKVGIWLALYCHYLMRSHVQNHITYIIEECKKPVN
jgi:membrane-associated phospholipid phosphatase